MTCLILRYGFRSSTLLHKSVCFINGIVNVTFPIVEWLLKDEMNIPDYSGEQNGRQYLKTCLQYSLFCKSSDIVHFSTGRFERLVFVKKLFLSF